VIKSNQTKHYVKEENQAADKLASYGLFVHA